MVTNKTNTVMGDKKVATKATSIKANRVNTANPIRVTTKVTVNSKPNTIEDMSNSPKVILNSRAMVNNKNINNTKAMTNNVKITTSKVRVMAHQEARRKASVAFWAPWAAPLLVGLPVIRPVTA